MKTIRDWNDLSQFGIKILTGEACRHGMRYLCDVDEGGARVVREFLGLAINTQLAENWNSGSVASVMLPYDIFRQFAAFCLLHDGAEAVAVVDGGVYGSYPGDEGRISWDERLEMFRNCKTLVRTYGRIGGPGSGSRMTHQMSGRTE